ncbi:MAG: Hsp20/alpha crystallin family protein [Candidatus Margulisiibacteriota bacterium]
MIETRQPTTIIPLDLNSMMQLLAEPQREDTPLSYRIEPATTSGVIIDINVSQCDIDAIVIDLKEHQLSISAPVSVHFLDNPKTKPLRLVRESMQCIPLPPGIDLTNIRSQLDENRLILTLPFK